MDRPSYVCTVCSETFTRRYSAKRHNNNLHYGAAEIVRLVDYLAGRLSGQYMANNPFWFKRKNPYHDIGSATVADSVGGTLPLREHGPQAPRSQYDPNRPMPSMDDQETGLSQGTQKVLRIKELKGLMNKHPQQHIPDGIIRLAIFNSIIGDNQLLDQSWNSFIA